jgi:hypothetical protein
LYPNGTAFIAGREARLSLMGALLGLLFWFFVVIVYFYAFGDAT